MGPPEKQPLFPVFSCFESLSEDEDIVAEWFSCNGEISPLQLNHSATMSSSSLKDSKQEKTGNRGCFSGGPM